jgi:hypothetical protein
MDINNLEEIMKFENCCEEEANIKLNMCVYIYTYFTLFLLPQDGKSQVIMVAALIFTPAFNSLR